MIAWSCNPWHNDVNEISKEEYKFDVNLQTEFNMSIYILNFHLRAWLQWSGIIVDAHLGRRSLSPIISYIVDKIKLPPKWVGWVGFCVVFGNDRCVCFSIMYKCIYLQCLIFLLSCLLWHFSINESFNISASYSMYDLLDRVGCILFLSILVWKKVRLDVFWFICWWFSIASVNTLMWCLMYLRFNSAVLFLLHWKTKIIKRSLSKH